MTLTAGQFARHYRTARAKTDAIGADYAATIAAVFARQQRRSQSRLAQIRRAVAIADVPIVPGGRGVRHADPPAPTIRAADIFVDGLHEDLRDDLAPKIAAHTASIGGVLLGTAWAGNALSDLIVQKQTEALTYIGQAAAQRIDDTLIVSATAGDSFDTMTSRIGDLFDGFRSWYADRVGGDEAVTTVNATAYSAASWGAVDGVMRAWVTQQDEKVRDSHAEADGQQQPVDTPFDVGGEALWYPGDPDGSPENVINCRCYLEFVGLDGEQLVDDSGVDASDAPPADEMAGDGTDQSG